MSKCFVVTGMHRSATSLLAKAMHDQDNVSWPCMPTKKEDDNQPYGYWESLKMVRVNETLLRRAGGSWFKPPAEEAILKAAEPHRKWIEGMLTKVKRGADLWGFKDPRTCLTFPVLKEALEQMGEEVHLVAIFRDPEKCGASIARMNRKISQEQAASLAREYNRRLVKWMTAYT